MKNLVDHLKQERNLSREEYVRLLTCFDRELLAYINNAAREVATAVFDKAIYIRGLIELTNYCRNNCSYCGIRSGNRNVERYRLSKEQILACCRLGGNLGLKTVVLQGGEDPALSDDFIEDLVRSIRSEFPDTALTLSLGERTREAYQRFFDAGANRYLLRHETANRIHYYHLHPQEMSFENRMGCLRTLKEIGYQTGAGMMIGSPGQSIDNLVDDIFFLKQLRPEMIGMGPFVPQKDTPFASQPRGSVELTLMLISICRLLFPQALIPSTTSLATLSRNGYEQGILAGANVVMPNLTPAAYRSKYVIYDNKKSSSLEISEEFYELKKQIKTIGYHFSTSRGDYKITSDYV